MKTTCVISSDRWRHRYRLIDLLLTAAALVAVPLVVRADPQDPTPCIDALEQVAALRSDSPVYRGDGPDRRFIRREDRPAEIGRLEKIIRESCSTTPEDKTRQEAEAHRLHVARSPECRLEWAKLAALYLPNSGSSKEKIAAQNQLIAEKCPAVELGDRWIVFGR